MKLKIKNQRPGGAERNRTYFFLPGMPGVPLTASIFVTHNYLTQTIPHESNKLPRIVKIQRDKRAKTAEREVLLVQIVCGSPDLRAKLSKHRGSLTSVAMNNLFVKTHKSLIRPL